MKKLFVFLLIGVLVFGNVNAEEELVKITVNVKDLYNQPIENAKVLIEKKYPLPDDKKIPEKLTKNGVAIFEVENNNEYILTVKKAGYKPYVENLKIEEDTVVDVVLEYVKETPFLSIKGYRTNPDEVSPGRELEIDLIVENNGTGDALNVKIDFVSVEGFQGLGYFSPIYPSSSIFLKRIDVYKSQVVKIRFLVSGDATSGIYNFNVKISYEDGAGIPHTSQETIGVKVSREFNLKILNVKYPKKVEKGESFDFSADVANIGRFSVKGIFIVIKGSEEFEWEQDSYYIGTLDSSEFDTFESRVDVEAEPGEYEFKILIGYVDDFNREKSFEESFKITVEEQKEESLKEKEDEGFWSKLKRFLKALLGLG